MGLRWADSLCPTLAGVAELAELRCTGLERVSAETRKWLFLNEVTLTEVERGDIDRSGARRRDTSGCSEDGSTGWCGAVDQGIGTDFQHAGDAS